MIKVFLVEDEVIVREGIKNNIPWSEHGLEFCGEASDGELAYPMIQKLKPDIVITDIKMPFMDGLALSTLIKKEFPWMEIIILSGFEEFDYAKKAINLGVSKYLTKPISAEELLREVDIIAAKITESKSEKALIEQYQQEMEENNNETRRALFHNLVSGDNSTQELLSAASELSIDLSAMYYNVILFNMKSINHTQEEYSNSSVRAMKMIEESLENTDTIIFDRNLDGKALLLKADSPENMLAKQKGIIDEIQDILKDFPHIRYFGGIGKIVSRIHEIPESFMVSARAFAHRYLVDESMFLEGDGLKNTNLDYNADFDISDIDTTGVDKQHVVQFLKTGNEEEIPFFIDEFFMGIGEAAVKSMMFRQYITMDTYFAVLGFVKELAGEDEAKSLIEFSQDALLSPEKSKEYITNIISKAISIRNGVSTNRYKEIVDEAVNYIKKNYMDDELSLNMLASIVNVSPSHLSMIFGQETGVTFIKFLTDYRLEKAKEMLKCTNKKSSAIAFDVGYKDPHYFSFIFKKSFGMTPTQYRGRKDTEGED